LFKSAVILPISESKIYEKIVKVVKVCHKYEGVFPWSGGPGSQNISHYVENLKEVLQTNFGELFQPL